MPLSLQLLLLVTAVEIVTLVPEVVRMDLVETSSLAEPWPPCEVLLCTTAELIVVEDTAP
jgi:hypothetical protein